MVTGYQYEQNTHSDSEFAKETIAALGEQAEKVTLVADGAYSGQENEELAQDNNIDLKTTNLTGKNVSDINADFQLNDEGTRVTECPNGQQPRFQCAGEDRRCPEEGGRSVLLL